MSVFNSSILNCSNTYEGPDMDTPISESGMVELEQQFLIEECGRMTEAELSEFLESSLCEQLVTEGKMRKNTIVFLSGRADLDRRTKMAAIQMAKDNNDPLWAKLKKNRIKEREIISKIMQKYGHKSHKIAKSSQKDWIRNRMPANFGKFGGQNRVSTDAPAGTPKKHNDGLVW